MKRTFIDNQKENEVKRAIINIFTLSKYKVKNKIKVLEELIKHYKSEIVCNLKSKNQP